ncbi:hypothetical protein IJV57_04935 [Candidatus Saccharibacteria bacterium]|nr:hypothetical protein [Candidatus Saccharibacteria bacterium]
MANTQSPFKECLMAISQLLTKYDDSNRIYVTANSSEFQQRVFLIASIMRILEKYIRYANKQTNEYRRVRARYLNLGSIFNDYTDMVVKYEPYVECKNPPSMDDLNERWFRMCANLITFTNRYVSK